MIAAYQRHPDDPHTLIVLVGTELGLRTLHDDRERERLIAEVCATATIDLPTYDPEVERGDPFWWPCVDWGPRTPRRVAYTDRRTGACLRHPQVGHVQQSRKRGSAMRRAVRREINRRRRQLFQR
jgi:hypothetical protein